jgi:hypothetical protein
MLREFLKGAFEFQRLLKSAGGHVRRLCVKSDVAAEFPACGFIVFELSVLSDDNCR